MDLSRRELMKKSALVGISYLIGIPRIALGSSRDIEDIVKIEFAMSARNFSVLPILLAIEQGFFQEEGLKPTERYFGSNELSINLAVGNLHLGTLATDYVFLLNAQSNKSRLKVIAGLINKPYSSIIAKRVTRTGRKVENPKDLRGATIAIPSRGGGSHVELRIFLRQYGLEEGRDYSTFNAKGVTNQFAALNIPHSQQGVDAVIFSPPWNFVLLEDKKQYVNLGETADVIPYNQFVSVAVNTTWGEANRETVVKFLKTYIRSCQYFYSHEEAVVDFASRRLRIGGFDEAKRQELMRRSWQYFIEKQVLPKNGDINPQGLEAVLQMQEESIAAQKLTHAGAKPFEKPYDLKGGVDYSYIQEAQRQLKIH